jgi:hypothetical protein
LGRFACALLVALVAFAGCLVPPTTSVDPIDAGNGGASVDAAYVFPAADAGAITAFALSPLTLTPPFSPTTFDYSVRCAAGENPVTLVTADALGLHSSSVTLMENQALVVGDTYWIRCLPHDFPPITVLTHAEVGAPTPGYYLVNSSTYAMVLDTNGTPVWYARGSSIVDVDSPEPNLISFSPNDTTPYGWSDTVRFELHALSSLTTTTLAAAGSPTDAHELRRLPNGDWLLFSYVVRNDVDLTGLSTFGADENMADCVVQEIDAEDNLVWSWTASEHVDPVRESLEQVKNTINGETVVDPLHCNSVDVDEDGNLLISLRHANAVFYVERDSGEVEWKLGGTPYNKDGADHITVTSDPEGSFNVQHDARFGANGDVTLFDDHGATTGFARAVEYAIDHDTGTASVVWEFLGSAESEAEGSFRRYPDGHSVIGWGALVSNPRALTEVDASGSDVLDVSLPSQVSYRAIKVPPSALDIDLLRATAGR